MDSLKKQSEKFICKSEYYDQLSKILHDASVLNQKAQAFVKEGLSSGYTREQIILEAQNIPCIIQTVVINKIYWLIQRQIIFLFILRRKREKKN